MKNTGLTDLKIKFLLSCFTLILIRDTSKQFAPGFCHVQVITTAVF